MTEIDVMRASLAAEDALARVKKLAGSASANIEQRVFYPYFHFGANGRFRWLFGERQLRVECLVDARTGRAASADRLTLQKIAADGPERLEAAKTVSEAERNARRYASHALGRGFRVIGNFNLELEAARLVHRPYWVVQAASLRLLVDAVSGELHPLAPPVAGPTM